MIKFGPRNNKEKVIFAQEKLRVDLQYALFDAMKKFGISKKTFKNKPFNHVFESSFNPNLQEIATLFHECGFELEIVVKPSSFK